MNMPEVRSENKNKNKFRRWAVILGAVGFTLFYFSATVNYRSGMILRGIEVFMSLFLLFVSLMPFSERGFLVRFLRIFTIVLAAVNALLYFGNLHIDLENPWVVGTAMVLKAGYIYLYLTLLEKIARSFDSDKEISIHIMKNFCITAEVMINVVPELLGSYSLISSVIMRAFLLTLNTFIVLFITLQILGMGKDIRRRTVSAEA